MTFPYINNTAPSPNFPQNGCFYLEATLQYHSDREKGSEDINFNCFPLFTFMRSKVSYENAQV